MDLSTTMTELFHPPMMASESGDTCLRSLVVIDRLCMISSRKADEVSFRELNQRFMALYLFCLRRDVCLGGGAKGGLRNVLRSIYLLCSEAIALARRPVAASLCKRMYLVSPRHVYKGFELIQNEDCRSIQVDVLVVL